MMYLKKSCCQFQKYSNGVNQSRRCDRSPQHPEQGIIPSVELVFAT
jgi:hypothetical protein